MRAPCALENARTFSQVLFLRTWLIHHLVKDGLRSQSALVGALVLPFLSWMMMTVSLNSCVTVSSTVK